MAHWIDKKQKTRVSDTDYNILSLGKKKTIDNTFGLSSRDYIEMNVFNSSGTFLDSIRIDEPKQYVNVEGKFEINPGIILRRNGYFSGDYDIEFNFFREIAGSNQTILVDSNKKIYTGEYDVLIDGRIVKRDNPKSELKELDYKYFVHQISNNKKEIRLATLPIDNERYKAEFEGLGENKSVIYPKIIGQDVLNFDNPSSKPPSNKFVLNNNSDVVLDKSLIGGELVINDAYEIMNLTEFGAENDGFSIGCHKVGKTGFGDIKLGDKNNAITGLDFRRDVFGGIAANSDSKAESDVSNRASRAKVNSGVPWFGGAYTLGYRTANRTGGFPIEILTTLTDLDKIKDLEPELTATIKGRDLVDTSNVFESTSKVIFTGNGTRTTLPIPQNHKAFGGLYDVELNLTFDISGTRRGIRIYRPNLFCVLPTYNKINDARPLLLLSEVGDNY